MSFSPRTNSILMELLQHDNLSVKELATLVGLSKRTMQRELNRLNEELADFALSFKTKPGKGIWLEGTPAARLALAKEIEGDTTIDNSSSEARQSKILLELLKSQDIHKIVEFAVMIDVSEATIRLDLKEIEKWLEKFHLGIAKTPGLGVQLTGSEANLRRAIRAYFSRLAASSGPSQRFDEIKEFMVNYHEEITELLDEDILERVIDCLEDIDSTQIGTLTETSYIGLVIHLAIVVKRIQDGETISYDQKLLETMGEDEDYQLAQIIAEFLEAEFDIELDEMELYYINLHLKGTKHQILENANLELDNAAIRNLINEMIDAYDSSLAFRLKQDDHFINGLLAHLQPTLIRLTNDMVITNPLLEQIKNKYVEEFEKCTGVAQVLERWTGKEVPVGEIGFLAIHFGSATMRMKVRDQIRRKVNVGVICATGIGLSRLMAVSLEKKYGDLINVYSFAKNAAFKDDNIDFFLASIKIENPQAELIQVNPIISEADEKNIEAAIAKYAALPERNERATPGFVVKLAQVAYYAQAISALLENMIIIRLDPAIDVAGMVAKVAEQPGTSQAPLIQAELLQREKLGTQIFNELGFGLLHTKTAGVDRPTFILALPDYSKKFTDPSLANVQAVICLLLPRDDHLEANSNILGQISAALIEDDQLLEILGSGSNELIVNSLGGHFENMMHKVISS